MSDLAPWLLGLPLSVTLENLATGRDGVSSFEIGRIAWSRTRRCAMFEPANADRTQGVPLSPFSIDMMANIIPGDPGEFDGLHGVFADSLPDGWGRMLVDREAEARGLRRSDLTPVDRLAVVGTSGMGALAYAPQADTREDRGDMDLALLADAAQRVLGEAREASLVDALELRAALGGSGGARPKIVCQLQENAGDEALLRPADAPPDPAFGHWLVKFASGEDGPSAGAVEYAYALMARAAGIEMPQSRLVTARDGRRFFAIRRFDRDVVALDGRAQLRRRHMLSASGALESEHRKYAFDYEALLTWVWQITKNAQAVEEAFRRAAFNVMAHNRDDHGRQHSALLDIDDYGKWRWQFSPAYDLTPSEGPGGEHSLTIAGAGKDITRRHLLALAQATPIRQDRATEILDHVAQAITRWPEFADDAGLAATPMGRVAHLHSIL